MVAKRRLNLAIDPPPDLSIEIDVTSFTQLKAYEALRVRELWCYMSYGATAIANYQFTFCKAIAIFRQKLALPSQV
jgi:Uma2 family endonuclease